MPPTPSKYPPAICRHFNYKASEHGIFLKKRSYSFHLKCRYCRSKIKASFSKPSNWIAHIKIRHKRVYESHRIFMLTKNINKANMARAAQIDLIEHDDIKVESIEQKLTTIFSSNENGRTSFSANQLDNEDDTIAEVKHEKFNDDMLAKENIELREKIKMLIEDKRKRKNNSKLLKAKIIEQDTELKETKAELENVISSSKSRIRKLKTALKVLKNSYEQRFSILMRSKNAPFRHFKMSPSANQKKHMERGSQIKEASSSEPEHDQANEPHLKEETAED